MQNLRHLVQGEHFKKLRVKWREVGNLMENWPYLENAAIGPNPIGLRPCLRPSLLLGLITNRYTPRPVRRDENH